MQQHDICRLSDHWETDYVNVFVFQVAMVSYCRRRDRASFDSVSEHCSKVKMWAVKYQEIIHDDFMAPLVGRYNILDAKLKNMEEDLLLKKGLKQAVKSYISKSDMREAKQTRWKSKVLYRQTRAASDGGIFAKLVKNKNLTPGGKPMPSTPHPIPVAGYSRIRAYQFINNQVFLSSSCSSGIFGEHRIQPIQGSTRDNANVMMSLSLQNPNGRLPLLDIKESLASDRRAKIVNQDKLLLHLPLIHVQ
ncbi:hypothetical protein L208DRAFT_691803 [Tricholoma matsutake]|nr:hypothetical protein L208DRAFT_691803 [Tricholoma matsutake 945]